MSTPEVKEESVPPQEQVEQQTITPEKEGQKDVEMKDAEGEREGEGLETESHTEPSVSQTPVEVLATPEVVDYAAESRKIEEKAKIYLARQTKAVIVPAFAAWFDMEEIHEIERRSVPEFFNNNSRFKTDKIYKDIRNFMINAYRLNPTEYLTVTAARRNIAADVASIIRIHAFLELWGLINYQIDPKTKPSLVGPQYTGHFQIILDTPEGLKPFIPQGAKVVKGEQVIKENCQTIIVPKEEKDQTLNLELRQNVFDSTHDAIAFNESDRVTSANNKSFTCSITGNDATDVRYHNLKAKTSISARAFKEGHFGSNFTSADFVRLEKLSKSSDAAQWTDQETLLLLEAIEMYEDDWEKISGHVGTKSKEQCITKFIQLPIEDKYLVKSIGEVKKETVKQETTNDAVLKTIKFLIHNLDGELASKDFLQNDADVQKAVKLTVGSILGGAQAEQQTLKKESSQLLESLVDLEISKVDHKLNKLSLLEKQLNQERAELAQQRKDVILDRLALKKQALDVRNKLIAATSAETTEERGRLAEEAVEISKKAPRVAVIVSKSAEQISDEDAKDKEAVEQTEEAQPLSQTAPESFQYWKL
jgi:chromatin structure-remodeling complex subunit RSC8